MKKYIEYYYNCIVDSIRYDSLKYYLSINNKKYMLKKIHNIEVVDNYYKIRQQLKKYGFFFDIVPNKYNSLITIIDNENYVLLHVTSIPNEMISIYDIRIDMFVEDKINKNFSQIWTKRWEEKIDYFEMLLEQKSGLYNKLYPVFQYYIGIGEQAILYLKNNGIKPQESDISVIQHYRLSSNSSLFDYYDPTNIMVDHASRDIVEYIKSLIVNGIAVEELTLLLNEYLDNYRFSNYGKRLMYARFLFPSFFFDSIEEIEINGKHNEINEEVLKEYEIKIEYFEECLTALNKLFKEKYNIAIISV